MPSSDRAAGYAALVTTFGPGEIADRLLTKWLADPDAQQKWDRLQARVDHAPLRQELIPWEVLLPVWTDTGQLTGRELAVLTAAANGLTSRKTGERVYRAANTIKDYRKQVIRKLGARNITHAVALYWRAST